jgi:hypothetical protein
MSGRSEENRFKREVDPFAYTKEAGDELAMADIEGRRHKLHAHDHLPHTFDPAPWTDCIRQVLSTRGRHPRYPRKQKR